MSDSTAAVRRRRTFFAVGWAVLLLAVVLPPLVVGPAFVDSGAPIVSGLVAVLGPAVLLDAGTARRKGWRVAGGIVRARTWSGPREVDLTDLATVRAWEGQSRWGGPVTLVSVSDRSGGWVILTVAPKHLHLLTDAVRHHGAGYVTPWAQALLGLKPTRWYVSGARTLGFMVVSIAPFLAGALLAAAAAQR
ncbi:hypothetical protein [Kitasatospora sp. NPDC059160]|uniref:hypothetical protein n=1 Tax=Kitasatospora sp. NPDC059160 TaxID=3346748 RepID=UPI0036C5C15F